MALIVIPSISISISISRSRTRTNLLSTPIYKYSVPHACVGGSTDGEAHPKPTPTRFAMLFGWGGAGIGAPDELRNDQE